jgi:hypothetical protein
MKVAVLSESPADEAAIRVFLDGLLREQTESCQRPRSPSGGKDAVFGSLPSVLTYVHYRTDADALCVVVDSDRSPVHDRSHEQPDKLNLKCRLCKLRSIVTTVQNALRPVPGRPAIKTAIGLAVPQIEAWYLAGRDPHVNEALWNQFLSAALPRYRREDLKVKVYGIDRPLLAQAIECARKEAERIVRDGHLPLLEKLFPAGFGAFARDVRAWQTQG